MPRYIDLDLQRGKLYWSDQGTGKIQRSNLDGSDAEDVLLKGAGYGIAVDPLNEKIYYRAPSIARANLDGSDSEQVAYEGQPTYSPDIALDPYNGKKKMHMRIPIKRNFWICAKPFFINNSPLRIQHSNRILPI